MRINPGIHLILGKEQLLDPRVKEWFPEIKALPLAALQLRIKTNSIPRLSKRIDSFLSNFEGSKFPLILNDYPFFADSRSFHGVHCGQDDWPLEKIKGASRLIKGLSTHNSEQLSLALRNSHLDYVGFGPWFPSETKETRHRLLSQKDKDNYFSLSLEEDKPIFCIGGISLESYLDLPNMVSVALSSDIWEQAKPLSRLESWLNLMRRRKVIN